MDHQEAIQLTAVERYLLDELPAPQREQFEEHFFGCQECARDLRAAAAFLDAAKQDLATGVFDKTALVDNSARAAGPKPGAGFSARLRELWKPAFLAPAFALLLMLVIYQNAVVLPRFAGEARQLQSPEILPALFLAAGNSRGAVTPTIQVSDGRPFLLSVDIPTREEFSGYTCALADPAGAIVWQLQVSTAQARDTVSIRIPGRQWMPGDYSLIVQGSSSQTPAAAAVKLGRYPFTLDHQN